jgi:arylsulfatase A-like enzyme
MSSVWTSQAPDQHHGETSFEARLPKDRLTLGEVLSGRGVHTAGFVANAMAGKALGFDRGFVEFHEVFGDAELGSRAELFRRRLPIDPEDRGGRFFPLRSFPRAALRTTRPWNSHPLRSRRLGDASRDAWYVDVNQGRTRPSDAEIAHLTRLYDGNLAYVDQELGALRKELESAGLWDDLTLVVAADHGEQLWEHGYISHSAQVYEESARVPLVMKLPKRAAVAGKRVKSLVDLSDVAHDRRPLRRAGQGGSEREFDGRTS